DRGSRRNDRQESTYPPQQASRRGPSRRPERRCRPSPHRPGLRPDRQESIDPQEDTGGGFPAADDVDRRIDQQAPQGGSLIGATQPLPHASIRVVKHARTGSTLNPGLAAGTSVLAPVAGRAVTPAELAAPTLQA